MIKSIFYIIGGIIIMFGFDLIWLGLIASPIYGQEIGNLLVDSAFHTSTQILGIFTVYILMSSGLLFFVLKPYSKSFKKTSLASIALGVIIYGIYEGTNLALLKGWTLKIYIIDIIWGGTLFFLTSSIQYLINKKLKWI